VLRKLTLTDFFRDFDHRIACHFRTRTGGGGNGDARQAGVWKGLPFPHHFKVIQQLPRIGKHGSHRFSGVNGAAAAKRNDHFCLVVPGSANCLLD